MARKSKNKAGNTTTLVVCIDRDDDLGQKVNVSGPIIGREKNLLAANKLALKDPTDSDVNALFGALRVFDRLKSTGNGSAEIATLTGDSDVGITSDRKIAEQLEHVLSKYNVSEAVLVTDGAEDEYVLPLLKSKVKVVYPERIVVRQNQQLESMYYMIYDFMASIIADPKASRIFVGLPALALMLYAIFGAAGGRLIIGVIGAYLVIKGFQLEKFVDGIYNEAMESVKMRRFSFLMYLSASVVFIVGILNGYKGASAIIDPPLYVSISAFLNTSVIMIFIATVLVGFGKMLGIKKRPVTQYLTYFSISFAVSWTTYEITKFILRDVATYAYIIYALVISGALILISSYVEKKMLSR